MPDALMTNQTISDSAQPEVIARINGQGFRFTLAQLMMLIALIAIVLALTQAEGCGKRVELIECISVSADGSLIAVAKLNARHASVSDIYKSDVSRTISLINTTTREARVIEQDYLRGDCGPAGHLWRQQRTSATLHPSGREIAIQEFGGGLVQWIPCEQPGEARLINLKHHSSSVAISPSGRFLAASEFEQITVWDLNSDREQFRDVKKGLSFLNASVAVFSDDEKYLAALGKSGVTAWDTTTGGRVCEITFDDDVRLYDIDFFPDRSLLVCGSKWVRRYDLTGNVLEEIDDSRPAYTGSASSDGRFLAFATENDLGEEQIRIRDLRSDQTVIVERETRANVLSFSRNGLDLYHGNRRITCTDPTSGDQKWSMDAPGRHRWSWPYPASLLAVWIVVASRLLPRR